MKTCFLALAALLAAAAAEPERFKLETFVWSNPGGKDLEADLYLPNGPGPFPVVVYLHGGGWTSGDRKQLRRQAAHMAEAGFAGFAIDYRLAPANPYPAAWDDSKAAVAWVRAHAGKYNFDARRVAAAGSSAGGHLAALLGTSGKGESAVAAVVAFNPVLDLTEVRNKESGNIKFLGGTCAEKRDICREASPVFQVHRGMPPFLILHGTDDDNVPYRQATHMTEAMKALGQDVTLFTAPQAGHTFWSTEKWYATTEHEMEAFLRKVLAK